MNVPIIKSSIAAVVSAGVNKFYYEGSNKDAIASGLLTGACVATTNVLFSLTSVLPSWFAFLGYYGRDVASALLEASIRWVVANRMKPEGKDKEKEIENMLIKSHGSFIKDFLVSLGAAVAASYIDAPIRAMLPPTLASMS